MRRRTQRPWDKPADQLDGSTFVDEWIEGQDGVPQIPPEIVDKVKKQFADAPEDEDK